MGVCSCVLSFIVAWFSPFGISRGGVTHSASSHICDSLFSEKFPSSFDFSTLWRPSTNQLLHQYCHQTYSTQFLHFNSLLLQVREASSYLSLRPLHCPRVFERIPLSVFREISFWEFLLKCIHTLRIWLISDNHERKKKSYIKTIINFCNLCL